ncbi:hypothetical protein MAM1_0076d04371 [Mucor ambiguus]|uniref:C2H2-type domain-containing protein n=1 Tax=Mucor ambiguus TaxID=91626 RepID=A0A0C9MC46_9FUNG|nr:hypothetical protein MAM1_0076d04371 [Mucor ambiguus]
MDPNDSRIIVQLVNTCFICRQIYIVSRDLNRHLHDAHDLPNVRYSRPEPVHIEMIPTEQYIYLNTLVPNFDNGPQHAAFVAIRHACSLCHSHYPTLERLFRHMEAHFRAETEEDHNDEIDQLNQSFDFFDSHPWNYRPNEVTLNQQEDAADAFQNENESFQTNDGMANEYSFHADDEGSDNVEEDEDSDQQESGHTTSGVDSQSCVDGDRSEEAAINDQQESNPQEMNGGCGEGFASNLIFSNDNRGITLGNFINGDNVNLNDQSIFSDITLQESVDEDIQDDNTVFEFIYLGNP